MDAPHGTSRRQSGDGEKSVTPPKSAWIVVHAQDCIFGFDGEWSREAADECVSRFCHALKSPPDCRVVRYDRAEKEEK